MVDKDSPRPETSVSIFSSVIKAQREFSLSLNSLTVNLTGTMPFSSANALNSTSVCKRVLSSLVVPAYLPVGSDSYSVRSRASSSVSACCAFAAFSEFCCAFAAEFSASGVLTLFPFCGIFVSSEGTSPEESISLIPCAIVALRSLAEFGPFFIGISTPFAA